jgi:geranylgeranyl diphosphate synthase type I
MSAHHVREPRLVGSALDAARRPVDALLHEFLADRRAEMAAMDDTAASLVDEIVRLLDAGGKRIRPALCLWAHRACGGREGPAIVRVAAALELLHTFALIHDDVMDEALERRGVPSTPARFAGLAPAGADPVAYGRSVAILVGDLAAVLSERLLRSSDVPAPALGLALDRFDRMRTEMAAGQLLDLRAASPGPAAPGVAALKTGSYTAEGPVLIGAALAGASPQAERGLLEFARCLGEAFQLRDDVLDGDASPEAATSVRDLVARSVVALERAPLDAEGRRSLIELAELLRLDGGR